jgi:hypothetical protein
MSSESILSLRSSELGAVSWSSLKKTKLILLSKSNKSLVKSLIERLDLMLIDYNSWPTISSIILNKFSLKVGVTISSSTILIKVSTASLVSNISLSNYSFVSLGNCWDCLLLLFLLIKFAKLYSSSSSSTLSIWCSI